MADNVAITAGIGTTIAADDVGGVLYQRIKLSLGPDGSATDALVGRQAAASSFATVTASDAYSCALTITRPANQTPYTANDNVGGALTFTNVGSGAGEVLITSVSLELDISAVPTGMTSFRLYLYNVTPPSALADNVAWDLPSGDRASFLGYVDLGSPVDLGSTLYVEINGVNKQIKLAGTSVFGYLVTAGGFTPAANSEIYDVTLHTVGC